MAVAGFCTNQPSFVFDCGDDWSELVLTLGVSLFVMSYFPEVSDSLSDIATFTENILKRERDGTTVRRPCFAALQVI